MKSKALIKDEKYRGKYVALKSFNDHNVVASGNEPSDVLDNAHKKGVQSPVLVFVPEKDITCVY